MNGEITVFCNARSCRVQGITYEAGVVRNHRIYCELDCEEYHIPESTLTHKLLTCHECDGFLSMRKYEGS